MALKDIIKRFKHTKNTKDTEMSFNEALNFLKIRTTGEQIAVISDNSGEKYICTIEYNPYCRDNFALGLYLYNQSLHMCSNMLYYRIGDILFLSSLQTMDDYKNKGLARKLNALSNHVLQNEIGTRIIGNYRPFLSNLGLKSNEHLSLEESDLAARHFYQANGFEFITFDDFNNSRQKHPYITEDNFTYGDSPTGTIITRTIEKIKKPQFKNENGLIVECEHEESIQKNA